MNEKLPAPAAAASLISSVDAPLPIPKVWTRESVLKAYYSISFTTYLVLYTAPSVNKNIYLFSPEPLFLLKIS